MENRSAIFFRCILLLMLTLIFTVGTATRSIATLTGSWEGSWSSYSGFSGGIACSLYQVGSNVSGSLTVSNTDCGTVSNVPVFGEEDLPGSYFFSASTYCQGSVAILDFSGSLSGNVLGGEYVQYVDGEYWDAGSFSMSRAAVTTPAINGTSPSDQATGVSVGATIYAYFNVEMDPSTITAASFYVAQKGPFGPVTVPGSLSYAGKTASFIPAQNLEYGTEYEAIVTTAVKDPNGNSLASDFTWSFTTIRDDSPSQVTDAYPATSDLWIKAMLRPPGSPVPLIWKMVGSDITPSGDQVISGYFFADPYYFAYGSEYNPEVFVKIYITASGWANIAFNHVTVDSVDVFSSHHDSGSFDYSGTVSLDGRLLEHSYTGVGIDSNLTQFNPGSGAAEAAVLVDNGYVIDSELWAKAMLRAPGSPVTLVWKTVGADTTPTGDRVVSGYFYADPKDFAFGSEYNPEVFVKIYIAANGWANMAYNHVTVDDVSIFSAHRYINTPQTEGRATLSSRLQEHSFTDVNLSDNGGQDQDNDGDGYTENQGDCHDANATIHPGATEICGDGIDQDCNGADKACPKDDDDDNAGP